MRSLFSDFAGKRIAVIGDLMLDKYFWGGITRISPEAPVPVVDVLEETAHLGGAANVAHNIRTLGATPVIFGVVGDDQPGRELRAMYHSLGFDESGICVDKQRPTTVKTRVMAHNQHVVRIDRETRADISMETQGMLLGALQHAIGNIDVLILEDYNKGVLVQPFIQKVIALATAHDVPVMVDPKFKNFFEYRGVALFKPNRKEMEDAFGATFASEEQIETAVRELRSRLNCENVLLTLGAKGMMLLDGDKTTNVSTVARTVADVSGAGDTVIATLAVAFACGATIREAATIANVAAGIVCEEAGIVPVTREALLKTLLEEHVSTN